MATYFQSTTRNFSDVKITAEGIDTNEFLQATEGLVKIFGNPFGSSSSFFFPSFFFLPLASVLKF